MKKRLSVSCLGWSWCGTTNEMDIGFGQISWALRLSATMLGKQNLHGGLCLLILVWMHYKKKNYLFSID